MKTLTNEEIIFIIENVCEEGRKCLANCPLKKECLYHFTGEKCGSALETPDKEKDIDNKVNIAMRELMSFLY